METRVAPTAAPGRPSACPGTPGRLNHAAYTIRDAAETTRFYRDVMGLELVGFVIDDKVPSTGDPFPYVHLFFELGDGSSLAFFETVGLPPPAPVSHPAYAVFNHLALDVGTPAQVDQWADHLRAHGVELVGPVDHSVIYSIYFHDPNGIRLELTCNTLWQADVAGSAESLEEWTRAKAKSQQLGGDTAPLLDMIRARRARHKLPATVQG